VKAPQGAQPADVDAIVAAGAAWWPLQMARELDDAILSMRTNVLDIGIWLLRTEGDTAAVKQMDETLAKHASHWFVRETIGMLRRTLARLDVSSRTLFALVEPGSCFVGTLAELAFAADRAYMLMLPDEPQKAPKITLTEANFGWYPMVNDQSRLGRAASTRGGRKGGAAPPRRATTPTGRRRPAPRSRRARRCRPTRSPAWKRTCASPAGKRWRRASSGVSPHGRTGSSTAPMPSATRAH